MQRTDIIVQFQAEYFHRWPNAPQEHAYLGTRHRHMLHIKASLEVFHDDREIEIIALKRNVEKAFVSMTLGELSQVPGRATHYSTACNLVEHNEASCESIAFALGQYLLQNFGWHRICTIEVLEDGENGAIWTYQPDVA